MLDRFLRKRIKHGLALLLTVAGLLFLWNKNGIEQTVYAAEQDESALCNSTIAVSACEAQIEEHAGSRICLNGMKGSGFRESRGKTVHLFSEPEHRQGKVSFMAEDYLKRTENAVFMNRSAIIRYIHSQDGSK